MLVDIALFLKRVHLDALQFASTSHRAFIEGNADRISLRQLNSIAFDWRSRAGYANITIDVVLPESPAEETVREIHFKGRTEDIRDEVELFQSCVADTAIRAVKLGSR